LRRASFIKDAETTAWCLNIDVIALQVCTSVAELHNHVRQISTLIEDKMVASTTPLSLCYSLNPTSCVGK
jgi:hypothetical protein